MRRNGNAMSKKSYRPHADCLDLRLQRLADELMEIKLVTASDTVKQALGAVIELKALANASERLSSLQCFRLADFSKEQIEQVAFWRDAIAEARKVLK